MVYINIPYVAENDRIDRERFIKELEVMEISEGLKYEAYAAVYNVKPRGVNFSSDENLGAVELENLLRRMGIGYRRTPEPEYK